MNENIRNLKKKNFSIVIALCFAAFMASLDSYIVTISLPHISGFFNVSINSVSNVVLVFLLFLVGTMLIAGKLADMIGLRNFFLLPFYLTGLNTQNAGLVLMIYSVVYMIAGPLAGKASDKINPEKLCMVGTIFSAIGCILFAFFLDIQSLIPVILLQIWLVFL